MFSGGNDTDIFDQKNRITFAHANAEQGGCDIVTRIRFFLLCVFELSVGTEQQNTDD